MKKSDLIQILRCLSKEEKREFSTFIQIKSLHREAKLVQNTINLFNYIQNEQERKLSKEDFYKRFFKDEFYSESKVKQLISALLFLLNRWLLLQNQVKKNDNNVLELKLEDSIQLLKAYKKINKEGKAALSYSKRLLKYTEDKINSYPYKNSDYHFLQMNLQEILVHKKGRAIEAISKYIHHIDVYSTIRSSQYETFLLRSRIQPKQYDKEKPEVRLITTLNQNLYLKKYDNLEEEYKAYEEVEEMLNQYKHLFTSTERLNFSTFVMDFCMKKINQGYDRYIEKYREQIEETSKLSSIESKIQSLKNLVGILLVNLEKSISSQQVDNTYQFINTKIEEIEKIIKETAPNIEKKYVSDMITYNQARVNFFHAYLLNTYCQKQVTLLYLNIEDMLRDREREENTRINVIKFSNLFIGVEARRLLAKAYYELSLINTISPKQQREYRLNTKKAINNLEGYLRNNNSRLPKNTIEKNTHFTKSLGTILRSKQLKRLNNTKSDIIEPKNSFSESTWLLQKVNQKIKQLFPHDMD